MKKLAICLVAAVAGAIFTSDYALAQTKASGDPFESRRRDAAYRENLRKQQALANRRVVPTFTIPQPGYGYNTPHVDPRLERRRDRRWRDGDYVLIPGHYQNVYGQLVYVPPHYQYVRR